MIFSGSSVSLVLHNNGIVVKFLDNKTTGNLSTNSMKQCTYRNNNNKLIKDAHRGETDSNGSMRINCVWLLTKFSGKKIQKSFSALQKIFPYLGFFDVNNVIRSEIFGMVFWLSHYLWKSVGENVCYWKSVNFIKSKATAANGPIE